MPEQEDAGVVTVYRSRVSTPVHASNWAPGAMRADALRCIPSARRAIVIHPPPLFGGTSISGAANAGKLMLVAVVSTAGVLALWLLPIILGCGALSIAYCLRFCRYSPARFARRR